MMGSKLIHVSKKGSLVFKLQFNIMITWCCIKYGNDKCSIYQTLTHLTHIPLVPHIWISESSQHWFRELLVTYSARSHYLNQLWVIVNWTLRNKLQLNFNQDIKLFYCENASKNIVCEMSAMLPRGRWVKTPHTSPHPYGPALRAYIEYFIGDWPYCQ